MYNIDIENNSVIGYAINARDLWEALGSQRQFSNWIQHKLGQLEATIYKDYQPCNRAVKRDIGATSRKDYMITIDIAKKIALMDKTAKGEELHSFIIESEERMKYMPVTPAHVDVVSLLSEQVKEREKYKNKSTFTATEIAREVGMPVIEFNKLLESIGVQYKRCGVWYPRKGYYGWYITARFCIKGYKETKLYSRFTCIGKEEIVRLFKNMRQSTC